MDCQRGDRGKQPDLAGNRCNARHHGDRLSAAVPEFARSTETLVLYRRKRELEVIEFRPFDQVADEIVAGLARRALGGDEPTAAGGGNKQTDLHRPAPFVIRYQLVARTKPRTISANACGCSM